MPFSSGVVKLQRISNDKLRQAQELRKSMTDAEGILWERLRRKQISGVKIRRQQIIEGFITDFFCESAKLVIEVDGSVHATQGQKALDAHRTEVFEARGLKELRFTNEQIESNIDYVINTITETLTSPGLRSPSPAERGLIE
jgi:very-short-patch-repair endonuclease